MAIKFLDVTYKNIFKSLNIEIKENQITSIVGKNGSGKTSFLNLIYALDMNFSGKITIGKKSFDKKTKNKKLKTIRFGMSYLIQEYEKQLFNINVFEDIKYSIDNADENKLNELLKSFNLNKEILQKSYFELSNSEKKKILIISILIKNSKIILLDDPTNGLDQKSITTLVKLLKKEKRNEKIIIIASQDSEFLLNVSDRILIIDNCKLIDESNKYDFFSNEIMLNNSRMSKPNIMKFRQNVLNRKSIKLVYRDNINDLLKDIYRNAK